MTRQRRDEQPHPECTHHEHALGRGQHGTDGRQHWRNLLALAIDTETTGPDPEADVIVELGAYRCFGAEQYATEQAQRFGMLINPGRPIPPGATRVHRIRDQEVADAPPLMEVGARFLARVAEADLLVGYNWPFDARILERQLGEPWRQAIAGKVVLDVLAAIRADRIGRWWKGKGRHKLDAAATRLGVRRFGKGAHRASSDAQIALGILYHPKVCDKMPSCGLCAQEWLAMVAAQDRARFEQWRRDNPRPAQRA